MCPGGKLISNFLKSCHGDFRSICTSLHSHQQGKCVPLISHPLQQRLPSVLFYLGILTGIKWYLRVILICVSLMAKDDQHFLKHFQAIWHFFLLITSVQLCTPFLIGLFFILMSKFWSSVYVLDINPLSDVELVKILSLTYAVILSYLPCPLPYRNFSASGSTIY